MDAELVIAQVSEESILDYFDLFTWTAEAGIYRANYVNKAILPLEMLDIPSMADPNKGQEAKVRAIRALGESYNTNHQEALSLEPMRDAFLGLAAWLQEEFDMTMDEYVKYQSYPVEEIFCNIAKQSGVIGYPVMPAAPG
jgi:hypothetical protein